MSAMRGKWLSRPASSKWGAGSVSRRSIRRPRESIVSTAQLELTDFAGPSPALKARLLELAKELLMRAGELGIGFDEVRFAGETRGILTGHESGRFLSFGALLMQKAGGRVVRYRKSLHRATHGRRVAVYVHRSYLP